VKHAIVTVAFLYGCGLRAPRRCRYWTATQPISRMDAEARERTMLADAAHGLKFAILRYSTLPARIPGRTGHRLGGDHPLNRGAGCAGPPAKMQIFGTDYPTPDGTCIRTTFVMDLARRTRRTRYLRRGGRSLRSIADTGAVRSVIEP
jgi:UDP-glucose 4-epimerase